MANFFSSTLARPSPHDARTLQLRLVGMYIYITFRQSFDLCVPPPLRRGASARIGAGSLAAPPLLAGPLLHLHSPIHLPAPTLAFGGRPARTPTGRRLQDAAARWAQGQAKEGLDGRCDARLWPRARRPPRRPRRRPPPHRGRRPALSRGGAGRRRLSKSGLSCACISDERRGGRRRARG